MGRMGAARLCEPYWLLSLTKFHAPCKAVTDNMDNAQPGSRILWPRSTLCKALCVVMCDYLIGVKSEFAKERFRGTQTLNHLVLSVHTSVRLQQQASFLPAAAAIDETCRRQKSGKKSRSPLWCRCLHTQAGALVLSFRNLSELSVGVTPLVLVLSAKQMSTTLPQPRVPGIDFCSIKVQLSTG